MNAATSILIVILAASPFAPSSEEVSAVVEACGGPQWTSRNALPQIAPDAATERMHYPTLDLIFRRNSVNDKWTLSSASPHGKDDALSTGDALRLLPCLSGARPHLPLFQAAAFPAAQGSSTGAPPAPRLVSNTDTVRPLNPFAIAGFALAFFGLIALLFRLVVLRRRTTPAGWLCTTCYMVSFPTPDENDELYCSVCGYGTPVAFDSNEAKEYFSTRKLKEHSVPQGTREQEV